MNIGQYNMLKVISKGADGYTLEDVESGDQALLPVRSILPELVSSVEIGQEIRVFVYLNSAESVVATTRRAKAAVGECAYLQVVDVNEVGAFLDWGLSKDLFVPFGEQTSKMQRDRSYVVYVYLDNTGRVAATAKIDSHLSDDGRGFKVGEEVDILLWERTPLGFKTIINNTHVGMLFDSEILGDVGTGLALRGYIAEVRPDFKINLTLQQHTSEARDELQEAIVEHLRAGGGTSKITDKSSPDEIFEAFGVSKKNFKRALGALYRARVVELSPGIVRLI